MAWNHHPPAEVAPGVRVPLNLGLNDGCYSPAACAQVLARYQAEGRLAFRWYTTADNDPLRAVIARLDGVQPDNVFLANGSGPILKLALPHLLEAAIKAQTSRMVKHLLSRSGFPVITPAFTYFKVPRGLEKKGLPVVLLPQGPEDGFALRMDAVHQALRRQDGLFYLSNPCNPTGNVMIQRSQVQELVEAYPRSVFWIDEAYVQYVDPDGGGPVSDLVPRYPNLVVSRTFSFAYGLAAVRVGYLLGSPELRRELEEKVTNYRLGALAEDLAVAALEDPEHLAFVRAWRRQEVDRVRTVVDAVPNLRSFPSQANFVLCQTTDGTPARRLYDRLDAEGVHIKVFEPLQDQRYDPYFRLTLGTAAENRFLVERIAALA